MFVCSQIFHFLPVGGGDGDFADPTGGEKQLEILLQDIEFYKRENEALKKQLAASKGVNGTMDRQMGELDHPDSGPVEDAEPSQSTQATADEEPTQSTQPADDSRSEFTLDASPIPGVPQNTGTRDTENQNNYTYTTLTYITMLNLS